MKTVLVIPAFNEGESIASVVKNGRRFVDSVIVVDDGSFDNTFSIVSALEGVTTLRHRINLGKGSALKTGCEAARRLGADLIVTMDGDGQHPIEHLPLMLKVMQDNNWQVLFTARHGGDKMPLVRSLGNWLVNKQAKILFNIKLRDMWCGFRVIKADCLDCLKWNATDYSGEIEMALKVGYKGLSYGEYFIPTIYNDRFKGVTILHGLKLLFQMVLWRFKL